MHYVFDQNSKRIGSILKLVGDEYSLAFNQRIQGEFRDFCGRRDQVWAYLMKICPDASVKEIGSVRDVLAEFVRQRNTREAL